MKLKGLLCGAAAAAGFAMLTGCSEPQDSITVFSADVPVDKAVCAANQNDGVVFVNRAEKDVLAYSRYPGPNESSRMIDAKTRVPNGLVVALSADDKACEVYHPFKEGPVLRYPRVSAAAPL
ncbi:MAG: hypothetical protein HYU57_09170 [Micavibrio aeruginosavorus]|nr:hypothetical protein [Micavibrio aeruginosavorus]